MKTWTPPPNPIYRAGKRKEMATKAIRYVKGIEELEGNPHIQKALEVLIGYRKSLDEI